MGAILRFFGRRHGGKRADWADWATYTYLILGTLLMFGPVAWLVTSSFKDKTELTRFPPRLLPYSQETVIVEGYDTPLPLFDVTMEDGSVLRLARVRRVGIEGQYVDPANPEGELLRSNINQATPVEGVLFTLENYIQGAARFDFWRYFANSV